MRSASVLDVLFLDGQERVSAECGKFQKLREFRAEGGSSAAARAEAVKERSSSRGRAAREVARIKAA